MDSSNTFLVLAATFCVRFSLKSLIEPTEHLNTKQLKTTVMCTDTIWSSLWRCNGAEESEDPFTGICNYDSKLLTANIDLAIAEVLVKPTVKDKKFLWIFTRTEQLVTFPKSDVKRDDHAAACESVDAVYTDLQDTTITCSDGKDDFLFEVKGFGACTGAASGGDKQTMDNVFEKRWWIRRHSL